MKRLWRRLSLQAVGATILLAGLLMAHAQDVRVWSISVEQNDFYRELEQAFAERYPQWELQFETFSQDTFKQTLPLAFESGEAPDVLLTSMDVPMGEMLDNRWLAPVAGGQEVPQSFIDRFPANTFVNGHNMVDGEIYGVPTNEQDIWGPGYMYVNRTVLREAGVDPDSEIPTTWSELLEVCERVTETGLSCFTASFNERSQIDRWWIPFTAAAQSSSPFNYQTGEFAYADPARLRAWELLHTMYESEYFIPGVETTDRETSRQIFALDQAAFYTDGAWMPSVFREGMGFPDLDFTVAAVPSPDDGVQGALPKGLLISRLHVTSQVSNPEAAWALVDFLTQPDGQYAQGYVGGGFGFLSFTDNGRWSDPDDAELQEVLSLGQEMRVFEPVPLLACGDMAQSTAYRDALADPSFAEEQSSVIESLVTGRDWAEKASELATGRQALLLANLEEERAAGLDVSIDYFTYPEWQFGSDFDYGIYPLCQADR
ncbi:MAG: ABC transporter substrate-binding protein [Trueperaceae bacterium]